jgi:hypothetical protein
MVDSLRAAVNDVLRRAQLVLIAAGVVIAVAACSGNTTPATNVTTSSATLNAVGGCSGGSPTPCSYYWQYGTNGQYQLSTPVQGPCGPNCNTNGNVALNVSVTGLSPNTTYQYQICGKGDNVSSYVCVGPDGTPNTSQMFTTGSTLTYTYDANGRLSSVAGP